MEHGRDIDENAALVVELLYGERDAESAELDDETRAELESLKRLRAVFESMPDEDPPSSVSAKLLSAAAQYAPKPKPEPEERRGSFAWLAGVFRPILMHPGLAAAASLVLVAGVAGALYVTGRGEVARPTLDERNVERGAAAPNEATDPSDPDIGTELGKGSSAGDDGDGAEFAPPSEGAAPPPEISRSLEPEAPARDREQTKADLNSKPGPPPRSRVRATRVDGVVGGGVIPRPDSSADSRLPKKSSEKLRARDSFDEKPAPEPAPVEADALQDSSSSDGDASESAGQAQAPSSPRRAPSKDEQGAKSKQKNTTEAKRLHGSAAAAADRGDCKKALSLGQKIRKLDSRYYDDVFLSDQRVRKCRTAKKK